MSQVIDDIILDEAFQIYKNEKIMEDSLKEAIKEKENNISKNIEFTLTDENYYSKESDMEYMSASQFKEFKKCEVNALDIVLNGRPQTKKEAFLQGQLFEEYILGNAQLFIEKNREDLLSSRGPTKGELKSAFKLILKSVESFKKQKLFMDIIKECDTQKIVVGEINGVKIKGRLDLFNPKTISIYDIKYMKDFEDVYSKIDKKYLEWYEYFDYPIQMAFYNECIKQELKLVPKQVALFATTKESNEDDYPDVKALEFSQEYLTLINKTIEKDIVRYDQIKKNKIEPIGCGKCNTCKKNKIIEKMEVI